MCGRHSTQEWFDIFQQYRGRGYWTSKANEYVGHGFFRIDEAIAQDGRLPKYDALCKKYKNDVDKIRDFLGSLHHTVATERALMRPPPPPPPWDGGRN
jgi:hypothetical protein